MIDKHYFEFQCYGCQAIWLMLSSSQDEEGNWISPKPKHCPNCGATLGEFVKKGEGDTLA